MKSQGNHTGCDAGSEEWHSNWSISTQKHPVPTQNEPLAPMLLDGTPVQGVLRRIIQRRARWHYLMKNPIEETMGSGQVWEKDHLYEEWEEASPSIIYDTGGCGTADPDMSRKIGRSINPAS